MRNAQPQQPSPDQLNESIGRTRAIMQQFKSVQNKEYIISTLLQQYPQLKFILPALRNGSNLESIANQMAQAAGEDINEIISRLNV